MHLMPLILICLMVGQGSETRLPVPRDCKRTECALKLSATADALQYGTADDVRVTVEFANVGDMPIVLEGPLDDDLYLRFVRDDGVEPALREGSLKTILTLREVSREDLVSLLPGKTLRVTTNLRLSRFTLSREGSYSIIATYESGRFVSTIPGFWSRESGSPEAAPIEIRIGVGDSGL